MWTFLLTRVLQALFTLWVVSVLVFFAARLTGSPDLALLPPDALPEHRQAFKQAYGLDKPVLVQYWRWISRAVQGDLGQGIQHKIAVSELIGPRLVNSLKLATVAITLAVCLALPLGVVAAVQRGRLWDRMAMGIGLGGQSMPSFWLALMLVLVFAVWLRVLPATGMGTWKHFILPGVTMGWFISAGIMRLVRSSMLEVLDAEFVKLARLKGLVEIHEDPVISAEALGSIEGIEGTLITQTNPPVGGIPWNLHQIDIEDIEGATGKGVWVAVLDTGIDYSHPNLAARVDDCYKARAGEDATDCMDYNGHGTHIAGIIAANVPSSPGGPPPTLGVAREARLIAVRVLNDAGGGYVSDLINGLSWVYSRPYIRVVNMSLGFYKGSPYPLLQRIVKLLYDAGVIMVAAAGNYKTGVQPVAGSTSPVAAGAGGEAVSVAMTICIPADVPAAAEGGEGLVLGADNGTVIQDPTCNKLVKFPARYPETIAVAAADMDLDIAYYSIRGTEVDITAPGGTRLHPVISTTTTQQGVVTCIGGLVAAGEGGECLRSPVAAPVGGAGRVLYGRGSGTSQAAAHVTGVVALMLQENPTLTPEEMRMILYETAHDLHFSPLAQGAGLIRAGRAVGKAED